MKNMIIKLWIVLSLVFFYNCGEHHGDNSLDGKRTKYSHSKHSGNGERQRLRGRVRQKGIEVYTEKQAIKLSDDVQKQIDIKTTSVKEKLVKSTLKAMGKVLAPKDRETIVGYAFTSRIIKIHVSIGDWVNPGQPLITLECEEVGNAKADFFKARTDFELSKLNFNREERLFKKDIGAEKDFLEAKARFQIAQATLTAAEKKLNVLGFSKKQINKVIDEKDISPFITVNSPISGRVIMNNAVLGAMIDQATEIMVVMDPTILWIDAEIFEKDLSKIQKNQKVKIIVPAYPEEVFEGQIHYIGDVVHSETRTITVRTRVDNKAFKLKPGMFADISIFLEQKINAITVPLQAVLDDENDKIVFVQEGVYFRLRKVTIGTKYNGLIEILKGLDVGDIVVVEGNYQLMSKLHEEALSHTH